MSVIRRGGQQCKSRDLFRNNKIREAYFALLLPGFRPTDAVRAGTFASVCPPIAVLHDLLLPGRGSVQHGEQQLTALRIGSNRIYAIDIAVVIAVVDVAAILR